MANRGDKALLTSILSTDYESFCRRAFETLNGAGRLSNDPYVKVVCRDVAKVAQGEVKRLIINLPARHGKPSWPRSASPPGTSGITRRNPS